MREKNIFNQKGISLVEVLASLVIISILFSIISAYFVSSYQQSRSITNKYSSVQLAESLLDVYKSMNYSDLYSMLGTTKQIDIQNQLQIDPSVNLSSFSATAQFSKHPSPILSDRVIMITVTVTSTENGVKTETSLEGYKRK